ncbi:HTH_38 domain-containing protein [Trichonephila clavipes]|nr:HTH_38 domain-containing protein [Trichonephila clavipes]
MHITCDGSASSKRYIRGEQIGDLKEIGQRVGGNQTSVVRICHLWIQEETTDQWSQSNPPRCITACDDRQILRMTVMDYVATLRTPYSVFHTSFSVLSYHSRPFAVEWNVRNMSIASFTLD